MQFSKLFTSFGGKELSNHLISLRLNDVFNSFELKTSEKVRKSKGIRNISNSERVREDAKVYKFFTS